MTAREWDNFTYWFRRSRLRQVAWVAVCVIAFCAVCAYLINAMVTAENYYGYAPCEGKPSGLVVEGGTCDDGDLLREAEWSPVYLVPWVGVMLAVGLLPLLNTALIGTRRNARRALTGAAALLDGRERMRRAEARVAERDARIAALEAENDRRARELGLAA